MKQPDVTTGTPGSATEISPDKEPGGLTRVTLFMLTLCLLLALALAFLNLLS